MYEKVYAVVRNYEHDGTTIKCFKNKEDAKIYALTLAQNDHDYFEFEEDFENCCYEWENKGLMLHTDGSVELWGYECENVVIELLETTIQ